jgi:hypothetical protein
MYICMYICMYVCVPYKCVCVVSSRVMYVEPRYLGIYAIYVQRCVAMCLRYCLYVDKCRCERGPGPMIAGRSQG